MDQPTAAPPLVTYDGLPAASGGAHTLRTRRPYEAAAQVSAFLAACTVPVGPVRWALGVWSAAPVEQREPLVTAVTERFGGPAERDRVRTRWHVPAGATEDALGLLAQAGPLTTEHGHPLGSLTASTEVRLVDPATGGAAAGVAPEAFDGFAVDGYGRVLGASGVRATIGTSASSVSLWLALPGDDRLLPVARHVQDHLPFRLSAKHWRAWTRTRDGRSFRSARVASPLAS